jgi:hypothetical protein
MHNGSEKRNTKRMQRKKDETEKDEYKIDETRGIVGDDVKERRFIFYVVQTHCCFKNDG